MSWEFGPVLRKIREDKRFKISYIAKRIGVTGSAISLIETGKNRVTEEILAKYLQVIRSNLHEFADYFEGKPNLIKPIALPVVRMSRANFDDFWHLTDKIYKSPIVEDYTYGINIEDPSAFVFCIEETEMVDCEYERGDYLVVTPEVRYRSGEIALVLIRPTEQILIREVYDIGQETVRLISKNPKKNMDVLISRIKIYTIDSIIKKQRKRRR